MNETPSSEDGSRSRIDPDPEPHPTAARFELLDPEGRLTHADFAWIGDRTLEALAEMNKSHRAAGEVRAKVVGDDEMASAHETHTGVSGTTDVLTFDLSEAGILDVDLMICADEAARQATDRGHAMRDELLLYTVHGILHCLGYDDHDEDAYQKMHALEDEILEAIGVGARFRIGGAS